ncbi:hypothetical protein EON62_02810, partial [archaeon]
IPAISTLLEASTGASGSPPGASPRPTSARTGTGSGNSTPSGVGGVGSPLSRCGMAPPLPGPALAPASALSSGGGRSTPRTLSGQAAGHATSASGSSILTAGAGATGLSRAASGGGSAAAPASAGAGASSAPSAIGAPSKPREARRFSVENKATTMSVYGLPPPTRSRLGLAFSELEQRATLGTGTFGRVKLVLHRKTNRVFALKMLQKHQIVALKQQVNIMNEKDILWCVDHPFVIKLYDTYKDRDRLYMLLELVQGGELFSRLQNSDTPGRVPVDSARFYSACVLDAFDFLHNLHIIYRDLKVRRCSRARARVRMFNM